MSTLSILGIVFAVVTIVLGSLTWFLAKEEKINKKIKAVITILFFIVGITLIMLVSLL